MDVPCSCSSSCPFWRRREPRSTSYPCCSNLGIGNGADGLRGLQRVRHYFSLCGFQDCTSPNDNTVESFMFLLVFSPPPLPFSFLLMKLCCWSLWIGPSGKACATQMWDPELAPRTCVTAVSGSMSLWLQQWGKGRAETGRLGIISQV